MPSKPCVKCGAVMQKRANASTSQWEQRRFCSPRCHGAWRASVGRLALLHKSYAVQASGCWEWLGAINASGYGSSKIHGRTMNAHRVVWELVRGPIASGLHLDHLCRNKRCVNPDHMEPVTPAENNRRMHAARSQCRKGHPLDGWRSYGRRGRFGRYCLTCHRQRETTRREARRVLAA